MSPSSRQRFLLRCHFVFSGTQLRDGLVALMHKGPYRPCRARVPVVSSVSGPTRATGIELWRRAASSPAMTLVFGIPVLLSSCPPIRPASHESNLNTGTSSRAAGALTAIRFSGSLRLVSRAPAANGEWPRRSSSLALVLALAVTAVTMPSGGALRRRLRRFVETTSHIPFARSHRAEPFVPRCVRSLPAAPIALPFTRRLRLARSPVRLGRLIAARPLSSKRPSQILRWPSRLDYTYPGAIYQSIAAGYRSQMSNAHDASSERSPIRLGGLCSNDCAAKERRQSGL